jgi:hypothetical protein
MAREWNTSFREPWNPIIKKCLDAIDLHSRLHLSTGDIFHHEQAEILRKYVSDLKDWIHATEPEGWHRNK